MHPTEAIAALRFEPLLPVGLIAALAALALVIVALAGVRRARGTIWRLAAFAVLVLWLAGPRLVQESRSPTCPTSGCWWSIRPRRCRSASAHDWLMRRE